MAEIEIGGIKFTGGKMMGIIVGLSSSVGVLYGGFEFYKDYVDMKKQISSYVSPDLSAINNHMTMVEGELGIISQEFEGLKQVDSVMNDAIRVEFNSLKEADGLMNEVIREQVNSMKENIGVMQSTVMDIKRELKDDMEIINEALDKKTGKVDSRIDAQDDRNRDNVEDVRGIINSFEIRMDRKIDALDKKIETLEQNLDKKIKRALDNPLANGG